MLLEIVGKLAIAKVAEAKTISEPRLPSKNIAAL